MKKRVGISVIAIIIVLICVALFFLYKYKDEEEAIPLETPKTTVLRYTVVDDYIENTVVMDGVVSNYNQEMYIVIESAKEKNQEIKVLCEEYQEIKKGEILYVVSGKECKSEINGKIKEILITEEQISIVVLDYDRLYIDAMVDYSMLDIMKKNEHVTVTECNPTIKDRVSEEIILGFGFEICDNMVPVQISNSKNMLPGTEVRVTYSFKNDVKTCYILKEMLLQDIDEYYVYVEENGERVKRTVVPGQEFSTINGDVQVEFVEILSGLSQGERIIVDIIG